MNIKSNKTIDWQTITNISELQAFFPTLENIYKNTSCCNFFNSPNWLQLWIKTYWQHNWKLCTFIAYDKEKPIAIAPFYIKPSSFFLLPNTLHLLGQGEPEESEVASEYLDLAMLPGYENEVLNQLKCKLKYLKFDALICRAVLKSSHIAQLVHNDLTNNYETSGLRYITNINMWSINQLSKNTRSRYKKSLKQLNKIGAKSCWVSPNNHSTFFKYLIQYHQARWERKGKRGAFYHSDFIRFHQSLIDKKDAIKMSAIIINNVPIAINYYFVDKDTLYFYQTGWDEKNYSNYSPGLSLHIWSISNCTKKYYDFMMGGVDDSYKSKFLCDTQPMVNIHITKNKYRAFFEKLINKI